MITGKLSSFYHRFVYEAPNPIHRARLKNTNVNSGFRTASQALINNGLVVLPRYFQGEVLRNLQAEFERGVKNYGYKSEDPGKTHLPSKLLSEAPRLAEAGLDPFVLDLIEYYWGKQIYLATASGVRIEPYPEADQNSDLKGWHHDNKRKQVKMTILLTDLPDSGQRMDFIPGTHKIWHKVRTSEDSRFTPERALALGKPVPCSGPAGTVVIFDTNGIHTPNRNGGPRRDTWTFNYTAGKYLFPMEELGVLENLTERQRKIARLH